MKRNFGMPPAASAATRELTPPEFPPQDDPFLDLPPRPSWKDVARGIVSAVVAVLIVYAAIGGLRVVLF